METGRAFRSTSFFRLCLNAEKTNAKRHLSKAVVSLTSCAFKPYMYSKRARAHHLLLFSYRHNTLPVARSSFTPRRTVVMNANGESCDFRGTLCWAELHRQTNRCVQAQVQTQLRTERLHTASLPAAFHHLYVSDKLLFFFVCMLGFQCCFMHTHKCRFS